MSRILFVKTSSLGDVVHQCPAVSDAARRFAGAQIDWVVEEPFVGVAHMHRDVHDVIPVAVRRWRSQPWRPSVWAEMAQFRRRIASGSYDCIIDSQGLLKSALVSRLARGERHGLDAKSAREPLAACFYDVRHSVQPDLHPVQRNRLLAAAALRYSANGGFEYGLEAHGESAVALRAPYAVLLSMTSRAEKLWPEARWSGLARALRARGLQVALPWGSRAERKRSERIRAASDAYVPDRLPIAELARLMQGAVGVVGVDTGLLHLAAALGVPSVGVFIGTDPARFGLYGGGRSRNVGSLQSAPSVEEVLAAFEEIAAAS